MTNSLGPNEPSHQRQLSSSHSTIPPSMLASGCASQQESLTSSSRLSSLDLLNQFEGLTDILAGLLTDLPIFVCVLDGTGSLQYANARFAQFEGISSNYVLENGIEALLPVGLSQHLTALEASECFENAPWVDLSIRHKTQEIHTYHVVKLRRTTSDGNTSFTIVGIDITARRQAEHSLKDHKSRLDYMVYHDSLTGLANRSLFYDRASKVFNRVMHNGENFALLLVNLDRFKNINDSLGHDAGDALLKHVAAILSDMLRESDSVARLGADEFIIILERVRSIADVELICQRILRRLSEPTMLFGHEVQCTASMGISFYPRDGDSIDQLLKYADIAKHRAKAQGKNGYEFFLQEMSETAVDSFLLENELRKAIETHKLRLHYQPQIDIRTGQIIGLEALVRWPHPERGMIPPVEFIPIAEETGLIEPLGLWVMGEACQKFQEWLSQGINFGKVAVNLSAKQFRMREFDQTVVTVLGDALLPPSYLELEITETSAMEDAEQAVHSLMRLSRLGVSLAIDDFGTGYSSLAYLRRFPIDKLKIDRSFVNDIDSGSNDATIAKSIIDLAKNMGLEVVAEGVEHLAQSNWLMSKGCTQVQGFYYAKPLSETELLTMITSERAWRDGENVYMKLDNDSGFRH